MAAVALSAALDMWGLVELEKLAYAAVGAPFAAGLADAGGRAAERFRVVADRRRVDEDEKQKIEEVINEVVNAPLKRERPFSKLTSLENLPPPLVELSKALTRVKDEVEKDAAVVAALVLYKTLINNAKAYEEWAELYRWARGLVERQEFTVAAGDIKRLRGAQSRLEEVAEEVRRELNRVLVLYSQSNFYKERPDLLHKLKQLLEVDIEKAEGLAEARHGELSKYSDANMGPRSTRLFSPWREAGYTDTSPRCLWARGLWRMLCCRRQEAPTKRLGTSPEDVARLWNHLTQVGARGLWVSQAGRIEPPLCFCGS
jgi:hypothetical protein